MCTQAQIVGQFGCSADPWSPFFVWLCAAQRAKKGWLAMHISQKRASKWSVAVKLNVQRRHLVPMPRFIHWGANQFGLGGTGFGKMGADVAESGCFWSGRLHRRSSILLGKVLGQSFRAQNLPLQCFPQGFCYLEWQQWVQSWSWSPIPAKSAAVGKLLEVRPEITGVAPAQWACAVVG